MKLGFIETTKIESAKEQLITAINLYFENKSPVSVHTLIRASHEIFDSLCNKQGLERGVVQQGSKWIKPEMEKVFWNKIVEAKNFFKHADKDSDPYSKIEWNPEISKHYILDTISLYSRLTKDKLTHEMIAFKIWYRINNPDMWDDTTSNIATAFKQATDLLKGHGEKETYEVLLEVSRKSEVN